MDSDISQEVEDALEEMFVAAIFNRPHVEAVDWFADLPVHASLADLLVGVLRILRMKNLTLSVALQRLHDGAQNVDGLRRQNAALREELRRYTAAAVRERAA